MIFPENRYAIFGIMLLAASAIQEGLRLNHVADPEAGDRLCADVLRRGGDRLHAGVQRRQRQSVRPVQPAMVRRSAARLLRRVGARRGLHLAPAGGASISSCSARSICSTACSAWSPAPAASMPASSSTASARSTTSSSRPASSPTPRIWRSAASRCSSASGCRSGASEKLALA